MRKLRIYYLFLFLGFYALLFVQQAPAQETKEHKSVAEYEDKIVIEKKLEEKRQLEEKLKKEAEEKEKAKAKAESYDELGINQINLPEDTTPLLAVKQINIIGNTLIPTDRLLMKVPSIYNGSDKPIEEAESSSLYDFRVLKEVISAPGMAREISTRTIQGFTQYILSVYQKKNYAGINVRVLEGTIEAGKLKDDVLVINVIEIPVESVKATSFDIEHNITEESYLRKDLIEEWSPVKSGQVANKKKLDDFINLLNLNPDRYVSATISEGNTPESLAVGYDVYEVSPWHYFIQMDNAGTEDRQWNPRLGLINTNLTGRDDKLTTMVQGAPERGVEDNYSVYGSYDFPLWTPRLRLDLFGGRSEYEVDSGDGFNFLGHGSFYGGKLRFNALQQDDWFFDVTTSLSQEKSKITSSFPLLNASIGMGEVTTNLWGKGVELYRRNDISSTFLAVDHVQSLSGASGQSHYYDAASATGVRTNADQDFEILTFTANHSQFFNTDKIHRVLGSFRYIIPNARLVPSKMTTFGGMYSVRGYKENRIVADGGILASLQYEYDLVKKSEAEESKPAEGGYKGMKLKKLAPVAFFDFGRAEIEDSVSGENGVEELASIGTGLIVEIGEHFNGALYYGFPLRRTDTTKSKDGRLNIGLMLRW